MWLCHLQLARIILLHYGNRMNHMGINQLPIYIFAVWEYMVHLISIQLPSCVLIRLP